MSQIHIESLQSISDNQQQNINQLIHQLNPDLSPTTTDHTQKIIDHSNSFLITAQTDDQQIVGMIFFTYFPQPIGKNKAMIEDFVVEKSFRKMGIGRKLMEFAVNKAKSLNCNYIELTSNANRCEANDFYKKNGFIFRETNCYRKEI